MFLNFSSGLDTFKYIKHNHLPAKELQIQHNYNPNFWTKAKNYYYVKVIFLSHKSPSLLTHNIYFASIPKFLKTLHL